jgi:hypothetical protein
MTKPACYRSTVCEEATGNSFSHGCVHQRQDKQVQNQIRWSIQSNQPVLCLIGRETELALGQNTISAALFRALLDCVPLFDFNLNLRKPSPTSCSTSNPNSHSIDIVW